MPTKTYQLMAEAIRTRHPVICRYKGKMRDVCPHVLGMTGKREKVLVWQFGGETGSKEGLPPGGEWRCMHVDEITLASLKPGEWREGRDHRWDQTCVETVDLDVMKKP